MPEMKKIIFTGYSPQSPLERYRDDFEFIVPSRDEISFSHEKILDLAKESEGILTMWTPIRREHIDLIPNIRAIATHSVGFDHIDVEYANSKGIAVINTPQTVLKPTAELTLALILDAARGISFYDRRTREIGNTRKPGFEGDLLDFASTPQKKTLGIVGFGRIGREVARMARNSLDMKIIYSSRTRASEEIENDLEAEYVSFDELLARADFVALHCPYTQATHHLIDASALSKMKKNAYLINMSRGKVVDESALVRALKESEIAGAALDVYEREPDVSKELLMLDNVVLAPHIGTYTTENRIDMLNEALSGITDYLSGKTPANIVKI